jgi:hypothetical protein
MENQKIVALQNIFSSRLDTLSHLLEVAESHFADDVESLLKRRIVPDMLPFGTQYCIHLQSASQLRVVVLRKVR